MTRGLVLNLSALQIFVKETVLKNSIFVKKLESFRFFSYSRGKVLTIDEDICTFINILLNVLVIIIKICISQVFGSTVHIAALKVTKCSFLAKYQSLGAYYVFKEI